MYWLNTTQFDYCVVLGVESLKWISLGQNQGVCRIVFLLEAVAEVLLSLLQLLFPCTFLGAVYGFPNQAKKQKKDRRKNRINYSSMQGRWS
jgi:hypothetical protein